MPRQLNALIIEDCEDDARRVLQELERGSFAVTSERVDSRSGLLKAIPSRAWDVVISDYAMPEFTALDALLLVNKSDVDAPFILVSGAVGEETAALLMRAGARDYIMKSNLERLVPAVNRELREAEDRRERVRLDRALRESEQRSRTIVETAASLILVVNRELVITECNRRVNDYLGTDREEVIGTSLSAIVDPANADQAREQFERAFRSSNPVVHDCRLMRANGAVLEVMANCAPLVDDMGRTTQVLCTLSDITERKRGETRARENERRESLVNRLLLISLAGGVLQDQLQQGLELIGSDTALGAQRSAILAVDEDTGRPAVYISHGAPADMLEVCETTDAETCLCAQAARTQRLQMSHSTTVCPGICAGLTRPWTLYAAPILSGGRTIAVLAVCVTKQSVGDRAVERLLNSVATALAAMFGRARAEDELVLSEVRFRSLAEQSAEGIAMTDPKGALIVWNRALGEIIGIGQEDALGRPLWDIHELATMTGDADRTRTRAMLLSLLESGKAPPHTGPRAFSLTRRDGSERFIELDVFPVRSAIGYMAGAIVRDVTEQKHAEARERRHAEDLALLSRTAMSFVELPADQDLFRYVGEQIRAMVDGPCIVAVSEFDEAADTHRPHAIVGLDRAGDLVTKLIGRAPIELTGDFGHKAREALTTGKLVKVGGNLTDLAEHALPAPIAAAVEKALGIQACYVIGFVRHGTIYGGVTLVLRERAGKPRAPLIEAFVNQASVALARNRSERRLRESEERFRQIAENIQEVFWLEDSTTHKILYISPMFRSIWGRSSVDLYGNPSLWYEAMHPEDRESAEARLKSSPDGEISTEYRIVRPDETERWIRARVFPIRDANGRVYRRAGIAADITDFKVAAEQARLQRDQLMQADKMASLGVLVSGVAHEINNPNNLITLNAGLILRFWKAFAPVLEANADQIDARALGGLPLQEALEKFITLTEGISTGATRIKNIVGDLRDFARADAGRMDEEVVLHDVIESAVTIVYNLVKNSTTHFSVSHDDRVPVIRGNIQQLEQVIINLIANACQALESRDDTISVSTHFDEQRGQVTVQVADTGRGIRRDLLQKVMDPFLTTKRDSGGAGLGLSVSYGIVNDHGGELHIESREGRGTTVRMVLPAP